MEAIHLDRMAANMADLFGDSDDDDDFTPAERTQRPASPAPSDEGAQAGASAIEEEAEAVEELVDDKDDLFQDKPAPRQPTQLRDYSDEDDDGVVQEVYERQVGPPAELTGALLPLPAANGMRLLHTSKFLGIQTLPMTRESLMEERIVAALDEAEEPIYGYNNQLIMRWRERILASGETATESNARFVTWSDGSKQLLLGDEVLDIADLDNASANQFLFVRRTGVSSFIQGQGRIIKKMQLRPASLSSKFHKQLLADSQKKHERMSKIKATTTVADPNRAKAEREKAEEERIRNKESLLRRQDREMKKYPTASRREARGSAITTQFLETLEEEAEYSDDDDPELTATEQARASLQRRPQRDNEEEAEAERRLARAKQSELSWARAPSGKKRPRADEDNEDAEMQNFIVDEDDEDIGRKQPAKKGRRGGLVISDDEDE